MVIFNSYVKLPVGNDNQNLLVRIRRQVNVVNVGGSQCWSCGKGGPERIGKPYIHWMIIIFPIKITMDIVAIFRPICSQREVESVSFF